MKFKRIMAYSLLVGIGFGSGTVIGSKLGNEPETATSAASSPGISINLEEKKTLPIPSAFPSETPSILPQDTKFFLTLSEKTIRVYELSPAGDTVFLFNTDVETEQLRQEDYESLCRGITVETLEEARSLLEDFGS